MACVCVCVTEQHQNTGGHHLERVGHSHVLPANHHLRDDAFPAAADRYHSNTGLSAVHFIHKQGSSGSRVGDKNFLLVPLFISWPYSKTFGQCHPYIHINNRRAPQNSLSPLAGA